MDQIPERTVKTLSTWKKTSILSGLFDIWFENTSLLLRDKLVSFRFLHISHHVHFSPDSNLPSLKMTALSYSWTTFIGDFQLAV